MAWGLNLDIGGTFRGSALHNRCGLTVMHEVRRDDPHTGVHVRLTQESLNGILKKLSEVKQVAWRCPDKLYRTSVDLAVMDLQRAILEVMYVPQEK